MRFWGKSKCDGRQKRDLHEETFEAHATEDIADTTSAEVPLLPSDPVCEVEDASQSPAGMVDDPVDFSYRAMESGDSGSESNDFYDAIHGIYNIGVTESQDKAALYGRMMHYYAEKATSMPYRKRGASVLWYMLAILISNPIIGLYTMGHFKDWDTWVTRNIVVDGDSAPGGLAQMVIPTKNAVIEGTFKGVGYLEPDNDVQQLVVNREEFNTISTVAAKFSQRIRGYACYEIFGELVFALFSLTLLCTSGMCCTNGRQRAQLMIPIIGLLYTVIYKILAMYILIISFKILIFYLIAAYPSAMGSLPAILLRFLSLPGIDASSVMQRSAMTQLLELDSYAHKWVIVYCLENVYITITDSIETVHALSKIFSRTVRKLIKRLRRQQELVYFTMNSVADVPASNDSAGSVSCSYMLLDSLLNKTTGSQESYIHDMYNKGVPDVGTYLDNIDVEEYKDSIARVGPKIMSQLRNKEHFKNSA